ncbi:hypothetical protein PPAR_a0201 [Pseudoalteromonas paragorgicola KMM 3548]|nr:hypothetical protein [Pseudoalteromonas distincta KMM 3548]
MNVIQLLHVKFNIQVLLGRYVPLPIGFYQKVSFFANWSEL